MSSFGQSGLIVRVTVDEDEYKRQVVKDREMMRDALRKKRANEAGN